jgi:TolB-like protein
MTKRVGLRTDGRQWTFAMLTVLTFSLSWSAAAQQLQQQGTKALAAEIVSKARQQQKRRIAVVPFRELEGKGTLLSAFLAEELTTHLFEAESVEIVERTLLDRAMTELRLNATGAIDPDSAKRIGKMIGADALVVGTIADLTSTVAVNCRLIDTEKGTVFAAAQTRIVKDDDIKRLMGVSLTTSAAGAQLPEPQGTPAPTPKLRSAADGFTFELQSCRISAGGVVCEFLVTNEREDFALRLDNDSRFIDDRGRQFQAARLFVGNQQTAKYGQGATVVAGVPTPARIIFENVAQDIGRITLLEVKGFARNWYTVQFRNIQPSR